MRLEANTCVPHGELDCPTCIVALDEAEDAATAATVQRPCRNCDGRGKIRVYDRTDDGRVNGGSWRDLTCADCGGTGSGPIVHRPRRGDDVEEWLKRMRRRYDDDERAYLAVDRLVDRYRECSDYGLTLRAEDDDRGDP